MNRAAVDRLIRARTHRSREGLRAGIRCYMTTILVISGALITLIVVLFTRQCLLLLRTTMS